MVTKQINANATATQTHGDFKPVVGSTGITIFVLSGRANNPDSMKKLDNDNLRPFTQQEITLLLMNDNKLRNALKGEVFWIAGKGMSIDGILTVDENGELRSLTEKERETLSFENKVWVAQGNQPLSFGVRANPWARGFGTRFVINALINPDHLASVMAGVRGDPWARSFDSRFVINANANPNHIASVMAGVPKEYGNLVGLIHAKKDAEAKLPPIRGGSNA